MKQGKGKKRISLITLGALLMTVAAFMTAIIVATSMRAYHEKMYTDGEVRTKIFAERYADVINTYFDERMVSLSDIASYIEKASSERDALRILQDTEHSGGDFKILSAFKADKYYDSIGYAEETPNSAALAYYSEKKSGCTGIVRDASGIDAVLFCLSLENGKYFDMIVAMVPLPDMADDIAKACHDIRHMPEYVDLLVCGANGNVCGYLVKDEETTHYLLENTSALSNNVITNFYTFLNENATDDAVAADAKASLGDGDAFAYHFTLGDKVYMVSASTPVWSHGNFIIAQTYDADAIVTSEYSFFAVVIVALIIFVAIIAAFLPMGIGYRKAWIDKMEDAENYEPLTGCNTYRIFERRLTELISGRTTSHYAVVYFSLTQYDILYENYGESVSNDILTFCGKVISTSLDPRETYGHISDGKFVMALRFRERSDLMSRIDMIYALIHNYNKFSGTEYSLSFTAGVYIIGGSEKLTISAMLSNAIAAQRTVTIMHAGYSCVYDEKIDKARQMEREIELRKDQAFINKEFIVYYQPKLNLKTQTLDGAEALVRWYYPETNTVYSPGTFLPIFEMDGFVEKLDRYVYLEVLSFIKKTVDSGRRVCPISVNVSRFTALQPDFLYFYIENKKKFGIADGFLMLEFTESFAYDNNDALRKIVMKLHENGIGCSIDDFGVGYSSYGILKDLPMDELKLDSFFIRSGFDAERDEKTLRSIISLGQALGMKVTQEGVELPADKKRITDYGCDVLQGYCYSRPIPEENFSTFLVERLGGVRPKHTEES